MIARQRIHSLAIIGAFLLCVSAGSTSAGEVTSSPILRYALMGGDQQIFSSITELVQDLNQNQEARFSDCISKSPPYGCTKNIITSVRPSPHAVKVNGEYHWYQLDRTNHSQSQQTATGPVSSYSGATGGLGATVNFNCPPQFSSRVTGPTNDRKMECIFIEPQSCPTDGNPINIGTGYKFEQEVDFSTSDDFLKIERRYINQYIGWAIEEPNSIVEILAGGTLPIPKYRSNKLSADYSVISQRKRYGSNLYSLESYTHTENITLTNPLLQRIVYVTLNGILRYLTAHGSSPAPINQRGVVVPPQQNLPPTTPTA